VSVAKAAPVLLITGPCGVGKTAVAMAASELLDARRISHAMIDADQLRWCHPSPPDDRFHTALGLRNLAAVWSNYRAAGAERLILAEIVDAPDDLDRLATALPSAHFVVARLRASIETIEARLARRESGESFDWHLRRAAELDAIMQRNAIGDIVLATDGLTVEEVATQVLACVRWLPGPN
jgi:hypothetical protein